MFALKYKVNNPLRPIGKQAAKGDERQIVKLKLSSLYGEFGANSVRINKKLKRNKPT